MAATFRIVSFNIRNGRALDGHRSWPFRRSAVADTISGLDADVVCLQEAFGFQLRWLSRRLPAFDVYGRGRNDGTRGERCAILTRRATVTVRRTWTKWYGDDADTPGTQLAGASFPRTAAFADLELIEDGATVLVVNTHLDEASARNRALSVE